MTDFWIVSALAPGYEARTITVGGAMSGYCSTGSVARPIRPPITITMDMTDASTGRSIKCFSVIGYSSFSVSVWAAAAGAA